MASVKIAKPRALAQEASRLRAAASSGDSAWRLTPPLGVPPSFAMSAWRCHRRSSLNGLGPAHAFPPTCWPVYSGPIVAHQSGGPSCTIISTATSIGYGANPPDPQWPGEARIAVSFVLNYEEGGENTILNGDAGLRGLPDRDAGRHADPWAAATSRPNRCSSTAAAPASGASCACSTSATCSFTSWAVGRALELNPAAGKAMAEARPRGGEPRLALDQLQGLHPRAGARPHDEGGEGHHRRPPASRRSAGTPAASACTRCQAVVQHGGFLYSSDSYNDDLPYWVRVDGTPHLIIPYTLEVNDMKFGVAPGFAIGRRLAAGDEGRLRHALRRGRAQPEDDVGRPALPAGRPAEPGARPWRASSTTSPPSPRSGWPPARRSRAHWMKVHPAA